LTGKVSCKCRANVTRWSAGGSLFTFQKHTGKVRQKFRHR